METKIIAFHLPQFHQIPENDAWWGEGFTEWTNVKKAVPLYEGHYAPRVPYHEKYYDLTDLSVLKWQAYLANEYGVDGFAYYHYWFNGHKLLEKPLEILLRHPEINQRYCISWANEPWTNGWVSADNDILISHDNRDESDWDAHFDYLSKFFNDERYIRVDGKPLIILYFPDILQRCTSMINRWRTLAEIRGYGDLFILYQKAMSHFNPMVNRSAFDGGIEFQPGYVWYESKSFLDKRKAELTFHAANFAKQKLGLHIHHNEEAAPDVPHIIDYDETWQNILSLTPDNDRMYPGAFVDWDNTPRKGVRGSVTQGASPEKFEKYMTQQLRRTYDIYHKDILFLFAWNEWAEGGYLEPDEKYAHGYLEAIKNAKKNTET